MKDNESGVEKIQTTIEIGAEISKNKQKHLTGDFSTSYQDLLDGAFRRKWEEFQRPSLPKHLVDNKDGFYCTCDAGPFKSMANWVKHTTKALEHERLKESKQAAEQKGRELIERIIK